MNTISEIREFAIAHHGSQLYGDKPYVYHLDMVYSIVKEFELGLEYEQGAYLHDLIEDTGITQEQIAQKTNKEVAHMVFAVSGFGNNRRERKEDILSKITGDIKSTNLKMVDRIANMMNSKEYNEKLFVMYCKEFPDYEDAFSKGDARLFQRLKELLPVNPKPKIK